MDTEKARGHLILIVSVPGGGKSVLLAHVKALHPELSFAVSCTTRPMRPGEVEGETYYFIDEKAFERRIENGDFLEWVQQDGGRYYGTLKSEITDKIADGKIVLREVEVIGARVIRDMLPNDEISIIYITAGSWEEMSERIKARAPISEEELEHRRQRYEREIEFASEADYVIENRNGKLDDAKVEIIEIINGIIKDVQNKD